MCFFLDYFYKKKVWSQIPEKLFCTKSRTSVLKARTFYSGMHVQSSLTFESEARDDPGEADGQKGWLPYPQTGNTKGGSITVPLTSCLTGLESAV